MIWIFGAIAVLGILTAPITRKWGADIAIRKGNGEQLGWWAVPFSFGALAVLYFMPLAPEVQRQLSGPAWRLPRFCAECGTKLFPQHSFCTNCATRITMAPAWTDPEVMPPAVLELISKK